MKVEDYVRTPYGIRKVKKIIVKDNYMDDGFYVEDRFIICGHKAMQEVKSSPNIIDLIEVGDYVNGYLVKDIDYAFDDVVMNNKNARIVPYIDCNKDKYIDNIKSIVTHEQFESMEYRIKE